MLELSPNQIPKDLMKYFRPKRKYGPWILRNNIVWWKRNCMPSSAKDRFTVDFESVMFFTKSQKYYFEQLREGDSHYKTIAKPDGKRFGGDNVVGVKAIREERIIETNGRNKRCVWDITPKPFADAHFAVYPMELVEPMIKSGCPEDGVVLDPFSGSGTTGIVARKLNRNFIGIELKPDYIKISDKRMDKELGMFK